MAEKQVPARGRYNIAGAIDEQGRPMIEITDRLAMVGMTFSVAEAIQISGMLSLSAYGLIEHVQAQAKQQKQGPRLLLPN